MAQKPVGAGWHKNPYANIEEYIEFKIKILRDEFFINLSGYDLKHFRELTTEKDVDAYARQLISERL